MNPSEEEVRAYLTDMAYQNEILSRAEAYRHAAAIFRAALALLDAARKDRERVARLEHQSEYGRVALDTNNPEFDNSEPKYTVYASAKGGRKFGDTLRAAIDQARGA